MSHTCASSINGPTDIASARSVQEALRTDVICEDRLGPIHTVAGVDVGFEDGD